MNLKNISNSIDNLVDERMRKVSLVIYNDAVSNTPVKTGTLKGSWRISRGDMENVRDPSSGQSISNIDLKAQMLNSGNPYEIVYVYNIANYAIYVERDNSMLRNAIFKAVKTN